ncbi:MAG TPA: energy transducer TonB [Candidatus Acidoferrales bacterium]|nr:energy transducer TonB [Candidatus Acidoferrales bacterium]
MLPCLRTLGLALLGIFACSSVGRSQDISVRVEAIRLLEQANAVSRPSHPMPAVREEGTFRAYGLDGTTKDGQFNNLHDGDIERFETTFGAYHAVSIHYPNKIVQNDYQPEPPEILEMNRLTPLLIGRFDKSDTINAITPATLDGRPAKCIQFETVNGRTHESNEICVDEERGTLIRWDVSPDLVEDTDYVQFEGVWLPAHIRHYINGTLRMEIEQKFSAVGRPIDWAALTPPHPHTLGTCHPYRRPVIQSAPQPANAGPGPWYDVHVHAVIGEDGHVYEAEVLPAGRPDLEKQAVQIVSAWTFSPPLCSGKPFPVDAQFVVHFPPR